MKIDHLSIENFKCFKAADFELGKLTLLTGANSSGKSTLLYSILGALQSGEFPFQFSPNGKYVNMGDFREMSHQHIKGNTIKIGITYEDYDDKKIKLFTWWKEDRFRKLPKLTRLLTESTSFRLEILKKKKYILNYEFFSDKASDSDKNMPELIHNIFKNIADYTEKTKDLHTIDKRKNKKLFKFSIPPAKFHNTPLKISFDSLDELRTHDHKKFNIMLWQHLTQLNTQMTLLDNDMNFISSFRHFPDRTYYEKSKTDLKVSKSGEKYIDQILLWETQKSKKYKKLIEIMKSLSLMEEIKAKRLKSGRYEVVVKINMNSVPASLNDVGFGISQFLPIVVADLQLGKDSTLFVAQPEIHLHPSVQAEFGTYMVNQIKEDNKNYIVETHSEYLLNRIRLAIVKGEIPKEDITIYYLQNDGEAAQSHRLEFTTDGRILNAPEDFFKTYQIDVMNIAMNANGE